jgi:uncharacterized protein (TIGR02147 family)
MKTGVLHFTNYKEFLRAWAEEKKKISTSFSHRNFARKAGISSPNYFQRVISTDLKLTETMVEKFVTGLGLTDKEAEYFRTLVKFNQCEESNLKIQHLRTLENLSKRSEIREIQSRNLLKDWYYPVIWELASCKGFDLTPVTVVSALGQSITKREAKEAIEFLESSGYLTRIGNSDQFAQPPVQIKSPDEILNPYLQMMHKKFAELSASRISFPIEEREFQGLTIALSPEKLVLAKQMIKKMTGELLHLLAQDSEADRVYRIQLQIFPVTQNLKNSVVKTSNLKTKGVLVHEQHI